MKLPSGHIVEYPYHAVSTVAAHFGVLGQIVEAATATTKMFNKSLREALRANADDRRRARKKKQARARAGFRPSKKRRW